ncbi:hypothetical protein OS188_04600 [Xanthomarina sp. F1114]|uniref:hypothetical protein n=1 Tax=Xanthomarina sp. F1114 TaxID=2996019 RepID=UPI00225E3C84|nr:hypothetical protein [Xanthomarina sp. F1114]MCX7547228.1 hypothetical protein [Xanthomarina sp. F1114]
MPIIKDENSEREDYLLQDDKKTKFGATFIIIALFILVVAVIISGLYFKWF